MAINAAVLHGKVKAPIFGSLVVEQFALSVHLNMLIMSPARGLPNTLHSMTTSEMVSREFDIVECCSFYSLFPAYTNVGLI